jgi:segregation and condensation protein B
MSLPGKIEAIIYAAEEPVTLDQLATLLKRDVLAELEAQAASEAQARAEAAAAQPASEISAPLEASTVVEDQSTPDALPPDAPTETSTGSEEPSDARQHPERAPESQEPLSAPESVSTPDTSTAPEPSAAASVSAPAAVATKRKKTADPELARVKAHLRGVMETVIASYTTDERGVEIRQIAGGYRMATKPEHHDLVRAFAKSLKPPIKLSLQALETLAIIAYKQPVTAPEIGEIRGVDSGGVLGTLLERKLITTAGRKQVIGRPIQYKTTKEFLMRFGMNDLGELPSMEEFEKLAQEQTDMFSRDVPAETGPAPADETVAEEEEVAEGAAVEAKDESAPESEPQRPPEEPQEPADAGDRSDGADTSETIVREQMENEK